MSNVTQLFPNSDDSSLTRVSVIRIVFRNDESGYAVIKVRALDSAKEFTAVGTFIEPPSTGMNLILRGEFTHHPRFGEQFKVAGVTELKPSTSEGIERYLASGMIKGIGKKSAQKLVAAFGEQTLEILEKDRERLKESGLNKKQLKLLEYSFGNKSETRETMRFLIEHQISPLTAKKIHKLYGDKTIEIVSKDPYRLARDIWGIGFAKADEIASNLGFAANSPERLRAGLLYTLEKSAESDGHSYLPILVLLDKARTLLQVDPETDLDCELISIEQQGLILREGELVALPYLARSEEFIAKFIAKRTQALRQPIVEEALFEQSIKEVETENKITLSSQQKQAALMAISWPLLVITGGPGCGKTTMVRSITRLYQAAKKSILLAAPTGRAAQRLAQVCEMEASTIHRLLKFDPFERRFQYNLNNQLPADVIIVDEVSMIDLSLAANLFQAISAKTVVILVGDKDQLPSVGAGRVLADLLAVEEVKSVTLNTIYRRSEESIINSIAQTVNQGTVPNIPTPDGGERRDAYFIPRSEAEEAASLVEKLVADQLPQKFGFSQHEISVLTPLNRGPLGTLALNKRLQTVLNPSASNGLNISVPNEKQSKSRIDDIEILVGDRVCQRVNNYQIDDAGVFNGDVGYVISKDSANGALSVEMWDGRLIKYQPEEISQLSLAYAISVHRSQGSEIPCVVLVLHDSHYALLERQLIYTAITRAKKLLVIVGSRRAFAIACKKTQTLKRYTRLADKIRAELKLE